jgi:hypothetical protein
MTGSRKLRAWQPPSRIYANCPHRQPDDRRRWCDHQSGWATAGAARTVQVTGLDQAGVLPNASGGLLQRAMIIAGFGWVVLLATRLLRRTS